ncbi:alpha,alpha-trehalose-phosphate synthase (UDP-forming) [Actinokineospora xionganensis]|uniref:Trehalose-6-phosphate synthase n=1 Tax=Actinokineospora xionganensis TaxID=2684470 RepID=A0ABR7L401_9PSEU|nr:trehalose-6-phosphate synthase [Actinokineospora xionganensis]MBC6447111.1 trehalose-6-phosphate synthase [Actinokineospora xionganensis]
MSSDNAPSNNGADFIVAANRLPVDLERLPDGSQRWKHSPGGLVSALAPFLRKNTGAWVGWPGVADVEVDEFTEDGLRLHPVTLTADEVRDYYEGFSNATLWPLYHDVVAPPVFDRGWWDSYVKVNHRFADACAKVAAPNATVWIQDYQLQLAPALLREQRPDLRIGFFLHIPFPPTELFMQLPWRAEIVRGLLGADLVGFHRPGGAQNFLWLARRLLGLEPTRGAVGVRTRPGVIQVGDRAVRVGAFPISIDSNGLDALARKRETVTRAAQIRADLGNPKKIILGVDRLDYTKGIDLRLYALQELLTEGRIDPQDVAMVQLATPSRERVEHYQRMRGDIEQVVSRINGEFARVGRPVVHYLHQSVDRAELAAFFSAADVMLVTPVRDGMNLVAKEYVACRHDLGGALVLSEFAGAAAELTSAFLVNPHDLDGVKNAMHAALTIDPAEGRRRMRALRRQVLTHDVDRWARSFLDALSPEQSP